MKKTICIIGAAGNTGSLLAKKICDAGYPLLLMDKDHEKLIKIKEDLKWMFSTEQVELAGCPHQGAWEADMIILSVPYNEQSEVANKIKEVVTGKIILSINNKPDSEIENFRSAAEELQDVLSLSKVVKAFIMNFQEGSDCFLAGNDFSAIHKVTKLVKDVNYNPVLSGDLKYSNVLEKMYLLLQQIKKLNQFITMPEWQLKTS